MTVSKFSSPGCRIFIEENTPSATLFADNESEKSIPFSNMCFSQCTDFILDCGKKMDPEYVFNVIDIDETASPNEQAIHDFLDELDIK